jgi:hypothetical protein
MTPAYWISQRNEVIPVRLSHIQSVIQYPSKFGYKKQKIVSVYKKYREKLGTEDKAREEIIRELVCMGWIRLRRYTNKYWSITISELNKKNKEMLKKWASKMLKRGIDGTREKDKYMPVHIVLLKKGKVVDEFTIHDISKGKLSSKCR